jgi:hypothetical protein
MMGTGGESGRSRGVVIAVVCAAGLLGLGLIVAPMLLFAGSGVLFESGSGCSAARGGSTGQPPPSQQAQYGVPWTILAGIGTVESDNGQTTLPGVHSGSNAFGAAGPMQIGIGGAAGNVWGGAPVHPASEVVDGVATDEDGGPDASVYDPADAIAGAAKYLLGRRRDRPVGGHLRLQPPAVLRGERAVLRGAYAGGNFSVVSAD